LVLTIFEINSILNLCTDVPKVLLAFDAKILFQNPMNWKSRTKSLAAQPNGY
jgi:hypothetical protein